LLGLLSYEIVTASQQKPLWADLTGGMSVFENLKNVVSEIRTQISEKSDILRSMHKDSDLEESCKLVPPHPPSTPLLSPRSNIDLRFPPLPTKSKLDNLRNLQGMVDLERTIVIIGMGEVGPWGNQRTRWDIESRGELSIEGCVELAWIMGLIKYHNGPLKDGSKYVGWIDSKSGSPIKDVDVKFVYEVCILGDALLKMVTRQRF
jgi:fatty acid synthase subunit alpha